MRVAAIQLAGGSDDLDANDQAIASAMQAAAAAGAELAVLPELAAVPYFCAGPPGAYRQWSTAIGGDRVGAVARSCTTLGLAALYPFYERGADGRCHNSALLIDCAGRLVPGAGLHGPVPVTRKLHLPTGPGGDEAAHFIPGDDLPVFDLGPLRVGCLICYDRRFPECWRALRALGADLIAVPVAGASGEDDAFVLGELRTHARENGLAVVCAAKVGVEWLGGQAQIHPGGSCVIAADGQVLARCDDVAAGIAIATVTGADVATARRSLPLYEQRRHVLLAAADPPAEWGRRED